MSPRYFSDILWDTDGDGNILIENNFRVPKPWTISTVDEDILTVDENDVLELPTLNFIQLGTGAVNRTQREKSQEVFSLEDFGAVGDGVTNDSAAILAAIAQAMASSSEVRIIRGANKVYLLNDYTTHPVPVPVSGPNYTTTVENLASLIYLFEADNLVFDMPESTLKTNQTGFIFILADGPRNVEFNIGRILTPTAGQVNESDLDVEGLNAIAITSTTRDSWGIKIPSLFADHCKTGIYVFGDQASSYRVRGVDIGVVRHNWGSYGVALHNNGYDVDVKAYISSYVGRPFFIYGVDGVRGHWNNLQRLGGLSALIKSYDAETRNLDINYRIVTQNTSVPALDIGSEHNVGEQPVPETVKNVKIHIDTTGSTGGGARQGIRFSYQIDGVFEPTCAITLFDNITLSGQLFNCDVVTEVLQNPTGLLNTDNLRTGDGPIDQSIYVDGGFHTFVGNVQNFPLIGRGFNYQPRTTTESTQYGGSLDHRASGIATNNVIGYYLRTGTLDGAVTHDLVQTLRIANNVRGTGATHTVASGIEFEEQTTGVSNYCWRALNPFRLMGADYIAGTGSPEGVVTAPIGSVYTNKTGGAGTTLYIKESGAGNTGWVAK